MADGRESKKETSKDKGKIKVIKNGPYLVSGRIPLVEQIIMTDAEEIPVEWRAGNEYSSLENCALCRCGQSKNKPFCDGTHIKVNFDGTETATREPCLRRAKEIEGPALKLTDAEELCASARFCHRAGEIWNLVPKSDKPEAKKIAIEEAGDCPSGHLVIWDKKNW